MKIRNGFVSNSSSSSYIIDIRKLTDEQKAIFSWAEYDFTNPDLKEAHRIFTDELDDNYLDSRIGEKFLTLETSTHDYYEIQELFRLSGISDEDWEQLRD